MRYASVCSGIEAPSVAWHGPPLNWTPVFFSEIEPFPCAVLKHHYPHVPNLGDMTKFKDWPDYAIDVLIGGTPCQSFSIAGLRKGMADPRGNLALTFLAIVDRYKPRWIVWENVPGVHSSWSDAENRGATEAVRGIGEEARRLAGQLGFDAGTIERFGEFEEVEQTSDFDCFLAGLDELGYGFAAATIDAQYRGLAQRRERVFVVGHIGGQWQRAVAVLFDAESLRGNSPPSREKGKGTTHDIAPCVGASGRGFERGGDTRGQDPVVAVEQSGVIPIQEIGKRQSGNSMNGVGHGQPGDPMFTLQRAAVHGVAIAPPITGQPYGDNPIREGLLVAHSLRADGFDASEDGTGRGTPLVPVDVAEVVGTLSDGAHMGGGRTDRTPTLEESLPSVAWALQERDSKGADSSTKEGHLIPTRHGGFFNDPIPFDTTQITSKSNYSCPKDGDPCHPLAAGAHPPALAFDCKASGQNGFGVGEIASTMRSMGHNASHQNGGGHQAVMSGMAVRRLTPTECARLQGFPDDYLDIIYNGKPACDGPKYKALGNSMAVPCILWIGEQIEAVEQIS